MTIEKDALNTMSNPEKMSELSQNLLAITQFINERHSQKEQLKINSLSKYKTKKPKNTKEKTKKNYKEILEIIKRIGEQINEGHTIYQLNDDINLYKALFEKWQQTGWLTIINNQPTRIDNESARNINTPIILQVVEQASLAQFPKNSMIFWLQRHWYAEYHLAHKIMEIAKRPLGTLEVLEDTSVNINDEYSLVGPQPNTNQQLAINKASQYAFSIITGGPGTGKTFTVAKLVTQLFRAHELSRQRQHDLPEFSIALTAPTGKAAQRMQESLSNSLGDDHLGLEEAKTLHRLLGIGVGGIPKYHANNPLPYDLVIVDEASMLGLELASLLVDAIKPTGRLILLGDANQLAAVDAGSVLADLCDVSALAPYRTELTESKRFDSESLLGQFARLLQLPSYTIANRSNKKQSISQLLTNANFEDDYHNFSGQAIPFYAIHQQTDYTKVYQILAEPYQPFFSLMQDWYIHSIDPTEATTRQQLFSVFDQYRILSAGHQGALGTQVLNKKISDEFYRCTKLMRNYDHSFFYHGLPFMIKHNDYQLGLFNGDIGICLSVNGELIACFPDKSIAVSRLSIENCERAYVMTIHKSQGSEYQHVSVCLDKLHYRLLSQELIYTAVTRSKSDLSIISEPNIFERAIMLKGNRQTGLALQFT